MAASPLFMSSTGGQVTMTANTPIASSSYAAEVESTPAPAVITSTTTTLTLDTAPPNLFDPSHIPTIFPRIQSVSRLLIDASNDANSLFVSFPEEQQQQSDDVSMDEASNGQKPVNATATIFGGPDIALGAMTEDDMLSGYEAALAPSLDSGDGKYQRMRRTELAQKIVQESRGLREAFERARQAIDALEGGEMDIEEQERLISVFEQHNENQRKVAESFALRTRRGDVHMKEG